MIRRLKVKVLSLTKFGELGVAPLRFINLRATQLCKNSECYNWGSVIWSHCELHSHCLPTVLNAKQGNSMNRFSRFWYDLTGNRTPTYRVKSELRLTGGKLAVKRISRFCQTFEEIMTPRSYARNAATLPFLSILLTCL